LVGVAPKQCKKRANDPNISKIRCLPRQASRPFRQV